MAQENFFFFGSSGKVDYLTPRWLIKAIGPFDLDPCGCLQAPYACADKTIYPPQNGLNEEWEGLAYVNPPYGRGLSGEELWLKKLGLHPVGGIACVPAKVEGPVWEAYVWKQATGIFFIDGRVMFNDAEGNCSNGYHAIGIALIAYGQEALVRLQNSNLKGALVTGISKQGFISARGRKDA